MQNKVVWSALAQETYLGALEYYQQFSQNTAENLETMIVALTDRLATFKYLCPPAPKLSRYRKCVLTEHVSVIYEINKNTIFITAFIDNRADHLY